jgi:hypothetical protein
LFICADRWAYSRGFACGDFPGLRSVGTVAPGEGAGPLIVVFEVSAPDSMGVLGSPLPFAAQYRIDLKACAFKFSGFGRLE